jgi:hypothetical protein
VAPVALPGPQIAFRLPKSPGPGAAAFEALLDAALETALDGADEATAFEPSLRPQAAVPPIPTTSASPAIARHRCLDTKLRPSKLP